MPGFCSITSKIRRETFLRVILDAKEKVILIWCLSSNINDKFLQNNFFVTFCFIDWRLRCVDERKKEKSVRTSIRTWFRRLLFSALRASVWDFSSNFGNRTVVTRNGRSWRESGVYANRGVGSYSKGGLTLKRQFLCSLVQNILISEKLFSTVIHMHHIKS